VQAGSAQAQLNVGDGYNVTEYWGRSGAAAMLVRAVLMLGRFCLFVAAHSVAGEMLRLTDADCRCAMRVRGGRCS